MHQLRQADRTENAEGTTPVTTCLRSEPIFFEDGVEFFTQKVADQPEAHKPRGAQAEVPAGIDGRRAKVQARNEAAKSVSGKRKYYGTL